MDEALRHCKRYTRTDIREALELSGFRVETIFDFNRLSVPGWLINGKLLRRRKFSRVQLKVLDMALPFLRHIDRVWPWGGISLIAVAGKDQPLP